jgi:MYXO-CTERM domain-containing protein
VNLACRHAPAAAGTTCDDGDGTCRNGVCEPDPTGEGGEGGAPGTGGSGGSSATAGSSGSAGSSAGGGSPSSGGSSPTGGAGPSNGGTTGEEGGAAGEAGATGQGGAAGEGGEGGSVRPPTPPVSRKSGCSCDVVGTQGNAANHAWLAALALAAVTLRRRRRSLRGG